MRTSFCIGLLLCLLANPGNAQSKQVSYTHADSLKGTVTKERAWWDVSYYDIHVQFNIPDSSINGYNRMRYKVLKAYQVMQIDLMEPMQIDSIVEGSRQCKWRRDGNAFLVTLNKPQNINEHNELRLYFHGKPHAAKSPPWDGGVVWSRDKKGNPWISIACQGMAAQVWFPNKDHMYDEVDSAGIHVTTPTTMIAVANGRLRGVTLAGNSHLEFYWAVVNPINNYNIIPNLGQYANAKDTIIGKGGILNLDYWMLSANYEKAKVHFKQVKSMLHCFEDWFGPYPFYEDGYKLVETPFLGMEHQSGIAYGNDYQNGYMGRDLSGTGWGEKWDFIIIHESGHEWFGNSITAKDVADNWVHEGFTAYSENLYVEYLYGKKAGAEYVIGTRKSVLNDKPIISAYDVNAGGSIDLYYKASNMLHTIRQIVNNDSLWKEMMRGLNKTFWHQTVTTKQIEDYMIAFLKLDLQKVFDQYLRTTTIPVFEYKIKKGELSYRWTNCVKGFNMQMRIFDNDIQLVLQPGTKWKTIKFSAPSMKADQNYYVNQKQAN